MGYSITTLGEWPPLLGTVPRTMALTSSRLVRRLAQGTKVPYAGYSISIAESELFPYKTVVPNNSVRAYNYLVPVVSPRSYHAAIIRSPNHHHGYLATKGASGR